jgi:hypothetical protein
MEVIGPDIAGEPQTGKRWIRQSLSKIQQALQEQKTIVLSREKIRCLLNEQKIRPKSNVKRLHPKPHPDRDQQFQYINSQRVAFHKAGWPCISVDTKKKELLGFSTVHFLESVQLQSKRNRQLFIQEVVK